MVLLPHLIPSSGTLVSLLLLWPLISAGISLPVAEADVPDTNKTLSTSKSIHHKRMYDVNNVLLNNILSGNGRGGKSLDRTSANSEDTADPSDKGRLEKRIYDVNNVLLNNLLGGQGGRGNGGWGKSLNRKSGNSGDTADPNDKSHLEKRIYDVNNVLLNNILGGGGGRGNGGWGKSLNTRSTVPKREIANLNNTRSQSNKRIYDANSLLMNQTINVDGRGGSRNKRTTIAERRTANLNNTKSRSDKRISNATSLVNQTIRQNRGVANFIVDEAKRWWEDMKQAFVRGENVHSGLGFSGGTGLYHVGPPGLDPNTAVITLINATPYMWRRGYCHAYQLANWCEKWALEVLPGDSFRMRTGWSEDSIFSDSEDTAGEVAYHLEGTAKPMSFMILRRPHHEGVFVRFLEELSTAGNRKRSELRLGFKPGLGVADFSRRDAGFFNFIIGGKEGDFYSTNTPTRWMRYMLPEIKDLPLREIALPRSHYAGLFKTIKVFNNGSLYELQTQGMDLATQLSVGGVRIVDLHPVLWKGNLYDGHGYFGREKGKPYPLWNGALGEAVDMMVKAINDWQEHNPGELIIVDVISENAYFLDAKDRVWPMLDQHREELYRQLKKLESRLNVPDVGDLTTLKMKEYIGDKTPGVLVRVDESWRGKHFFPGSKEGFVTNKNFPYNVSKASHESVDSKVTAFVNNNPIALARPRRNSRLFVLEFAINFVGRPGTLLRHSKYFWSKLYHEGWEALTDQSYPNWLSMDGIRSTELRDFTVIINHCFVKKKCGSLGGKVKGAK